MKELARRNEGVLSASQRRHLGAGHGRTHAGYACSSWHSLTAASSHGRRTLDLGKGAEMDLGETGFAASRNCFDGARQGNQLLLHDYWSRSKQLR